MPRQRSQHRVPVALVHFEGADGSSWKADDKKKSMMTTTMLTMKMMKESMRRRGS